MAIWLPFKANAHERNKTKIPQQRRRYCRICGKEVQGGGKLCPGCKGLSKRKQDEERKANK